MTLELRSTDERQAIRRRISADLISQRQTKKQETIARTEHHKLRFVHVRRWPGGSPFEDTPDSKGGVTVAFSMPLRKKDRCVYASVAICHNNDVYNKAEGRYYAAANYDKGEKVMLKVPKPFSLAGGLAYTFGALLK